MKHRQFPLRALGSLAAAANWVLEPVKGAPGVLGNWDYYDRYVRESMSNITLLINRGVLAAEGLRVGGVGTVHLPIRLFCPPEVSLLTLTS